VFVFHVMNGYTGCIGVPCQRADERLGNPSQRQPGTSNVQDKGRRPQVKLGSANPLNVVLLPFSALTLLVGRQEGIWRVKYWVLVCWWLRFL